MPGTDVDGLYEFAPVALFTADPGGALTAANGELCEALGYSVSELRARPLTEWVEPEQRSALEQRLAQLRAGELDTSSVDAPLIRKDGSALAAELLLRARRDEGGALSRLHGAIVTVPARAEAQHSALRESHELLRTAERLSNTGAWGWTIDEDRWSFSHQWLRIHGCDVGAELSSEQLLALAHPKDRARIGVAFERVRSGEAAYDVEHRIIRKNTGKIRVVRAQGELLRGQAGAPDKIIGAAQDVTETRKLERALKKSERRLLDAQRRARIGHWEWHVASNRAVCSPVLIELFGIDADALAHDAMAAFLAVVHPEDRAAVAAAMSPDAPGEGDQHVMECRVCRPDGELLYIHCVFGIERDASGRPTAFLGTAQDTSLLRQARSAKLRMRELDHRVKNNLAAVLGLLQMTSQTAEDLPRFVEEFSARVHAMAHVHEALAREHWGSVALHSVVRGCITAGLRTDAQLELDGPDLDVSAAVVQPLGLVLNELALNATKHGAFSTPDGQAQLSWRRSADDGELVLVWRERGGPPCNESPQPGVGLRLVRALVEQEIGGEVELNFAPAGAHHTLRIPR